MTPVIDYDVAGGVPFLDVAIQERASATGPASGPKSLGVNLDGAAYTLEARHTVQATLARGVRRLTPRECERLQGMPDDWTLVPYRGGMAADTPRYKAIGNSMARNVMEWLGLRIEQVRAVPSRE